MMLWKSSKWYSKIFQDVMKEFKSIAGLAYWLELIKDGLKTIYKSAEILSCRKLAVTPEISGTVMRNKFRAI